MRSREYWMMVYMLGNEKGLKHMRRADELWNLSKQFSGRVF